jgi:hypothetical protein
MTMNKITAWFLLAAAAAFGQTYEIAIQPGGMASDVVVTDMANYQHQDVWNLRLNKRGEWAAVPGYVEVEGVGLDRLKNAIEIYDDLSKDRFLVLYMADSLSRLEYPYNSIYTKPQKIAMPAGVTIDSSKEVYFNWHNGVLRISGATSEPVWYSYVDRMVFESDPTYKTQSTGWKVKKCAITSDVLVADSSMSLANLTSGIPFGFHPSELTTTAPNQYEIYYFPIYDGGQYGLLGNARLRSIEPWTPLLQDTRYIYQYCHLDLWLLYNRNTWTMDRLTGVGIVIKDHNGTYYLSDIIPITDDDETSRYVSYDRSCRNHATLNHRLTLKWPYFVGTDYDEIDTHKEDGYLFKGAIIDIKSSADTVNNVRIDSVLSSSGDSLMLATSRDLSSLALAMADDWPTARITLHKNWVYVPDKGYHTGVGIDIFNQAVEYYDFTGIPAGTSDISCNYKMIDMIEGKSYAASQEARETGWVRYSPLYQYDVFPTLNTIQTKGSDLDEDITIVNRDGRLVIMNKQTIEQGSVANQYSTDVSFKGNGLYAPRGYLLNENILYVMDREDLYQFDGNVFRPFMTNTEMRNFYRERIDTTGFLGWDKLNREMVVVLNDTTTIVYQADYNSWYRRTTDLNGLQFGFLDHDSRLLLGDDEEIVTWNHKDTTYGEELDWGFTTKLTRASDFGDISQLLYLYLYTKCSDSVKVTIEDENESRVYSTKYMPATIMSNKMLRPRYWFEEAKITVENVPDSQNEGSAIIRKAIATIWK